jgi:hypothetical protein
MFWPDSGEEQDPICDQFWSSVRDGLRSIGFRIVDDPKDSDASLGMSPAVYQEGDHTELARVIVYLQDSSGEILWKGDYRPGYKEPDGVVINSPEDAITVRVPLVINDIREAFGSSSVDNHRE